MSDKKSEKELLALVELLTSRIETLEKEVRALRADYVKIMQTLQTLFDFTRIKKDDDEIFEKVFIVYERYIKLRELAKQKNIYMSHLASCSTFIHMFRAKSKSVNYAIVKRDAKAFWYHGITRKPWHSKPESHKSFENLPTFKKLLITPTNLITDKMLDEIIFEDMISNGAAHLKFFNEFITLMDYQPPLTL